MADPAPCAGEWENACGQLQRMLVVRALRPDRVGLCISAFVVSHLGSAFVEPPVLSMKAVSGVGLAGLLGWGWGMWGLGRGLPRWRWGLQHLEVRPARIGWDWQAC